METALHGDDKFVAEFAEDEVAAMAFDSRHREIRNF